MFLESLPLPSIAVSHRIWLLRAPGLGRFRTGFSFRVNFQTIFEGCPEFPLTQGEGSGYIRLASRRIEIAGAVSFNEPLFLWSPGFVHAAAALYGRPGFNFLRPSDHMRVRLNIKKLSGFIDILSD